MFQFSASGILLVYKEIYNGIFRNCVKEMFGQSPSRKDGGPLALFV